LFIGESDGESEWTQHWNDAGHNTFVHWPSAEVECIYCDRLVAAPDIFLSFLRHCELIGQKLEHPPTSVTSLHCEREAPPHVASLLSTPSISSFPRLGLLNVGNTCYANASLQGIYAMGVWNSLFSSFAALFYPMKRTNGGFCVHNFILLHGSLQQEQKHAHGSSAAVDPTRLRRHFVKLHPEFGGYEQQDAHEFLLLLLNVMHEALIADSPIAHNSSIISDLLSVPFHIWVECCVCGRTVHRDESQFVISLSFPSSSSPLPSNRSQRATASATTSSSHSHSHSHAHSHRTETSDSEDEADVEGLDHPHRSHHSEDGSILALAGEQTPPEPEPSSSWLTCLLHPFSSLSWSWSGASATTLTLQSMLDAHFASSMLDGDNAYDCDGCRVSVPARLRTSLRHAPPFLWLHCKRFKVWERRTSKITTAIQFPLEGLDLTEHVDNDSYSSRVGGSSQRSSHRQKILYDCIAVICHRGQSLQGGHYFCYALTPSTGCWFKYDDETVSKVDASTVANSQCYMLLYQQRETEMSRHQRKNLAHLLSSASHAPEPLPVVQETSSSSFSSSSLPSSSAPDVTVPLSLRFLAHVQGTSIQPSLARHHTIEFCPHGQIEPDRRIPHEKFLPLPTALWSEVVAHFGGRRNASDRENPVRVQSATSVNEKEKEMEVDNENGMDRGREEERDEGMAVIRPGRLACCQTCLTLKCQMAARQQQEWFTVFVSLSRRDEETDNKTEGTEGVGEANANGKGKKKKKNEEEEEEEEDSLCYFIEYGWWRHWLRFATKCTAQPPGPIRNHLLWEKERVSSSFPPRLKRNLGISRHYRVLTGRVWRYLWEIYGGGPMMRANACSLYATSFEFVPLPAVTASGTSEQTRGEQAR